MEGASDEGSPCSGVRSSSERSLSYQGPPTKVLCPVVPLYLHPAQLIPQSTWAPFPCCGASRGKLLPTEQIFPGPARPAQPSSFSGPSLREADTVCPGGSQWNVAGPQDFLHPRQFAVTSPGYAGFNCPSCCFCWEKERGAHPTCHEGAPDQGRRRGSFQSHRQQGFSQAGCKAQLCTPTASSYTLWGLK